jgi:hypothetical protein
MSGDNSILEKARIMSTARARFLSKREMLETILPFGEFSGREKDTWNLI